MKRIVKQMVPIALIMCFTVIMSLFLYHKIMIKEEARCWSLLEDFSVSVTKEMQNTLTDDINVLRLAANMVEIDSADRINTNKLKLYSDCTIFSRVDIIYPGDRIVLENGTEDALRSDVSFESVAQKGEHMSERMIDTETGREAVYYFVPVRENDKTIAVLAGVMESAVLVEKFHPDIYEGNASYCIIDSRDGNYIMDAWHDELGKAYTTSKRKRLKSYENIDLQKEIKAQNTGVYELS